MIQSTYPTRVVSAREAKELYPERLLRRVRQRLQGVLTTTKNLIGFIRTLSVMSYTLDDDGAVCVQHTPTGSWTLFRADGNIDTYAVRNNNQMASKALLLNCSAGFDAKVGQ